MITRARRLSELSKANECVKQSSSPMWPSRMCGSVRARSSANWEHGVRKRGFADA